MRVCVRESEVRRYILLSSAFDGEVPPSAREHVAEALEQPEKLGDASYTHTAHSHTQIQLTARSHAGPGVTIGRAKSRENSFASLGLHTRT